METEEEKEDRKKKKQNQEIVKDRTIRDITTLFEQQEEDYYKPKRVSNFWNNNYIEYKSNGSKNRNLLLDEYLNKIEAYLRNITINLGNSDEWKIQLAIAINFNNLKFTHYSDANVLIEKLFKSLRLKYQENLKTSIKGSDFIFDSVQLMYYKCHKVNFTRGGSYIDSPDWIKKKKINPIKNKSEKYR